MKTNLSAQIKLDRIPRRYYDPKGDIEIATLTRDEKIYTRIFESVDSGSLYAAGHVAEVIGRCVAEKGRCVLALGAGMGTLSIYNHLIAMHRRGEVSFKNVVIFNLCEFFPLLPGGPSTMGRMREVFLDHVDIPDENVHTISAAVTMESMFDFCKEYERQVDDCGGIDLTLCEIGPGGALGLNEPGSRSTGICRLVLLSGAMRQLIQDSYKCDECPTTGITLGLGNILRSAEVMAVAWGETRSRVVRDTIEGPVTDTVPASFLQLHNHARVVLDLSAADDLIRIAHPWKVTSCEWDPKLIRRAIVWLCSVTGKPILKLTDKDYNDWGLGELVALYGSAYNVNIRVFNELQHTITGWPGGKPDADDSSRPERANPYPKRVIVFSPHPDDDVISMGGTLKRLVDQGHDVHVAYETSGNIAVGDEDMMRYFMMMDRIAPMFGFATDAYLRLSLDVRRLVESKKSASETDTPEVREIKTMIRQAGASLACNYIGVKPANVHFLRLPFYETGTIKKGDLTEKDVDIVKRLLEEVKPHQIFVAGDLADPHGTHRVCTDAVLAAIDELKHEPWMADCRIWMYRGAWAEWEIDHIEMAVPISPEELRFKRNSILKHQSQMENAPFLGDDDRLFWQRAEERNRATARLYEKLGMASYEAMEAFVRYIPV